MPTFSTPGPITLTLDIAVGDIRLTAADRAETVVEVRPTDPARAEDVRAAERTTVDRTTDGVLVRAPNQKTLGIFGRVGSIDLDVALPAGSHLQGDGAVAAVRVSGRLGDCRVKTATGDLLFQQVGAFDASTSAGDVVVESVAGRADITSATGAVRIGRLDAVATVKASNGAIRIGEAGADLKVKAANGEVVVDVAQSDVVASIANGDLTVRDLVRGTASLKTGHGSIAVGIHQGTAARLDVGSSFGRVTNSLAATDGPGRVTETLELHAHTGFGDIDIRRA